MVSYGFPIKTDQFGSIWISARWLLPRLPRVCLLSFTIRPACAVNHRCRLGTSGETAAAAKPHELEKMGGGLWHWITMVTYGNLLLS